MVLLDIDRTRLVSIRLTIGRKRQAGNLVEVQRRPRAVVGVLRRDDHLYVRSVDILGARTRGLVIVLEKELQAQSALIGRSAERPVNRRRSLNEAARLRDEVPDRK